MDPSLEKERIVMLPIGAMNPAGETQIRSTTNESAVLRYAALMDTEEGPAKFPPILVYRDENGAHWIADGHHRVLAAMRCQLTEIRAEIREGSKADALWAAAEINSKNGLPLEGDDIRQTIVMLIEAWPNKSLRSIADAVGCSKSYVGLIKTQMSLDGQLADNPDLLSGKTIGKDGKLYPAIRLKKPKDNANSNTGDGVFSISLSRDSTPTSSVSEPASGSLELIHLTERQQALYELYPAPIGMEELVNDVLTTFPNRQLRHVSFTLFSKIIGFWNFAQEAETSFVNYFSTRFIRSEHTTQNKILRDIFEHLMDDKEIIDKLMDYIKMKKKN